MLRIQSVFRLQNVKNIIVNKMTIINQIQSAAQHHKVSPVTHVIMDMDGLLLGELKNSGVFVIVKKINKFKFNVMLT